MTPVERLAAPHTPDLWMYQRQRAWLGRITDADQRALQVLEAENVAPAPELVDGVAL